MKFYKRLLAMAIVATVFISVFAFGATAYGSDNDVPFLVQVPGNQKKGYSKAEYRGSSGTEVPWKVDFTFSEEGKGTIMYFYLSGPWYEKVSNVKAVKQGSGNKYFAAYDSAQNMDVGLAIKNNNKEDSNKYNVAGYWDEETAKHAFSC